VLKDVQGLSYPEIHDILGHPISTLKIRAVRGRAALREALLENTSGDLLENTSGDLLDNRERRGS
jgi:DNA-directed RNA polymerase specialized sigma24 family protein